MSFRGAQRRAVWLRAIGACAELVRLLKRPNVAERIVGVIVIVPLLAVISVGLAFAADGEFVELSIPAVPVSALVIAIGLVVSAIGATAGAVCWMERVAVDRRLAASAEPPARPRLLVLLLDGVAFERIDALYRAGKFRAFGPPARLISVFPTLTDPAYDLLFGTGPTPGYEAGHFDRGRNRLRPALLDYLRGRNEHWVRHCDYRLSFIEDAVMYLRPRAVWRSELRRARRTLDERLAAGQRQVALYLLSTDGIGHMLRPTEIEAELARLDAWISEAREDYPDVEIVILSDHGLGRVPDGWPCVRRFDLPGVLRSAGLRVARRLRRPGDVVVPCFGLLDVARLHAFDAQTRERAVEALRGRPEVEALAERSGETLRVFAGVAEARVRRRAGISVSLDESYSYEQVAGDPLGLEPAVALLRSQNEIDAEGFARAGAWLRASGELAFPAAPQRLWEGLFGLCVEQPDVVVSLTERWFVGSGLLSGLVRMQGTHGGLHRRDSETFVMTTRGPLASPLDLRGVAALLRGEYGWRADKHGPRGATS